MIVEVPHDSVLSSQSSWFQFQAYQATKDVKMHWIWIDAQNKRKFLIFQSTFCVKTSTHSVQYVFHSAHRMLSIRFGNIRVLSLSHGLAVILQFKRYCGHIFLC